MRMARVILFTNQMDAMSRFYGKRLASSWPQRKRAGWSSKPAASIALHSGPPSPGRKGPKIAFYTKDVAALREVLVARGARFGNVRQGEVLCLCDGKDPDGNPLQLSNR